MLLRIARFVAELRLGRRIAARTARLTTTTSSSISVNARRPCFMMKSLVCVRGGDAVQVACPQAPAPKPGYLAAELRAARVDPVETPGHSLCFLVRILG